MTHLQLTEPVQQSPQEQKLAYLKPNGSKSIAFNQLKWLCGDFKDQTKIFILLGE